VLEALWPRSKASNVLFPFFPFLYLSAIWAGYSFSCGNRCGSGVLGMTGTQKNETWLCLLASREIDKRTLQISLCRFFSPITQDRKRSNNLEKTSDTGINIRVPGCDR